MFYGILKVEYIVSNNTTISAIHVYGSDVDHITRQLL